MALETLGEILRVIMVTGSILAGILVILIWIRNKAERISALRLFIQVAAVPVIFLGLVFSPMGPQFQPLGNVPASAALVGTDIFGIQFPDGLSVPVLACWYPSGRTVTCPIWQIQSYIFPFWNAGRGWSVYYLTTGLERLAIVFGLVFFMSIVLGRFFCGWICPFGLYMDLMIRVRRIFKKPYRDLSERVNTSLRQLRYIIIAAFLVLSVIFGSQAIFGTQLIANTQPDGYVYNYFSAPFCQVCPMKPLGILVECLFGFMNAPYVFSQTTGIIFEAGYYVNSLGMVVLILFTAGALAFRRFWCRLCPLGGLIALFSTFYPFKRIALMRLHKIEEKCTKCGICERVCPTQVKEVYEEKGGDVTSSGCMLCFRCVELCPYEDALEVKMAGKTVLKSRDWLVPSPSE